MNSENPLGRGLSVIQAFLCGKARLTVVELSLRTGLSRSVIYRCLYTLEKLGFVKGYGDRTFGLTPKVLRLGYPCILHQPIAISSQSVLKAVSSSLNETCSLSVLDEDEVRYVARARCDRLIQPVSCRTLPAYCTSIGRILLCAKPVNEISNYLLSTQLVSFTPFTKVHVSTLLDELDVVRNQSYSVVDQEYEIGLRSIAVPVKSEDGHIMAALNISVDAGRISLEDMKSEFLPVLYDAASEIGLLFR